MSETNGTAVPPDAARVHRFSALQTYTRELVAHVVSRLGFAHNLGATHAGMRQIEDVCGYKPTLTYQDYKQCYLRYDIAQRLVNTYPEETWAHAPTVQEDDQVDTETPFEQTWSTLADRLNIYELLAQADLQANLGHFAIVLIGLRNQPVLSQPAAPIRRPEDVLFLQPYSEECVTIESFGGDPGVPSYGLPTRYRLTTGQEAQDTLTRPRTDVPRGTLVDASRVIHVPGELRLDDTVYGLPYLEAVYNKLTDLLKVVGGGAEGFWRDARRRIALELQEGFEFSPEAQAAVEVEAEEFQHGARDFLRLAGLKASSLDASVASPKDHFDVIMQCIAGTRRIPVRMLLGTEEGRMAGDQDADALLRAVARRQVAYAERVLLRPLIQRLGDLGAYDLPVHPYTVDWGTLRNRPETERATVAKDYATATNQFEAARAAALSAGVPSTVTQQEFREIWVGLPAEPELGTVDEIDPALLLPSDEGQPAPPDEDEDDDEDA